MIEKLSLRIFYKPSSDNADIQVGIFYDNAEPYAYDLRLPCLSIDEALSYMDTYLGMLHSDFTHIPITYCLIVRDTQ